MKRRGVSAGVAIVVIAAGCASRDQGNSSSTASTVTSVATSSTTAPATTLLTASTTSPTTTTGPTTSTSLPPLSTCDGMVSVGASLPADYGEAAFDRFGPLDAAPSMTITFGHDLVSDPAGVRADRIEGGVLASASRSPNSPSTAGDQVPLVAINHDGTIRWSHCVEGSREIQTAVAAPQFRPANAVVQILTANVPEHRYRFVEVSLATGAEQSTFAAAMQSVGVDTDALTHLGIAAITERYALLADNLDTAGAIHRLVRYDLVAGTAVDIEVPAELSQAPTSGLGRFGSYPELSGTGDVIAIDLTTDVVSGAVDHLGTGAVLARWHDGTWTRDPSALVSTFGVRPGFTCDDNLAKAVLHGVDAVGQVHWTNPDLTHPGADDGGWYLDGDVAIGTCAPAVATPATAHVSSSWA